MARAPDPKAQEAKALYKKGLKLVDIAKKLEIPEGTVRRWKCTQKWDGERSDKKANVRNKAGAPKKNKNASGHGAPEGNKNAEKHGLFTKWLPEETAQIIGEIANTDPLDLLWNNIMLQQAAILRAQNIMHVTEKGEMIKELKKSKVITNTKVTDKTESNYNEEEYEYEFQFAWDRQATFLNAQSRAYATYLRMISQYDEMLHKNWDLATEEQRSRIDVLKKQASVNDIEEDEIGVVMLPPVLTETEPGVIEGGGEDG